MKYINGNIQKGKEGEPMTRFSAVKRFFAALLLATFLVPFAGAGAAAASATLSFSYDTEPEYIYDSGEADIYITVNVSGGNANQWIDLLGFNLSGLSFDLPGRIFSGDSMTFMLEHVYLSDSDFGRGIPGYLIYSDFSGATHTWPMEIKITKSQPQLSIKREAEPLSALPGDIIFLTYEVENSSGKTFTDVKIEDPAVGTVCEIAEIKPGEKVEVIKEVIFSKAFFSQPVMTSRVSGSDKTEEKALPALDISAEKTGLEVEFSADTVRVEPGSTCSIMGSVRNVSDAPMTDVRISCEVLGYESTIDTLGAGESFVFSRVIRPIADRDYALSVVAVNQNGKEIAQLSELLRVDVIGDEHVDTAVLMARAGVSVEGLSVDVTANATTLTEPGDVTFQIKIRNSTGRLTHATLSEKKLGEMTRIDTLVVGDKSTTVTAAVSQTTRFDFVFEAVDENGLPVMIETEPITIVIQEQAAMARDMKMPDGGSVSAVSNMASSTGVANSLNVRRRTAVPLMTVLLVAGAVIAICVIVLVFVYIREKYVYRNRPRKG